ncbi:MAG: hypothetical protein Q9159_004047 [Coniocarpon cinnabarinum]
MFDTEYNEHGARWDSLWQTVYLPFDKGCPSPALIDTMVEKRDLLGSPVIKNEHGDVVRKRALVPGCGRGYDVLVLASQGYESFGLEISPEAVKACNEFAKANASEYVQADASRASGSHHFIAGDFFSDTWRSETGDSADGFDLIFDYTFLSALPPSTRPAWASRMSKLLKSGGRLVCLEFPTYKEPESGGPPFALPPEVYVAHLSNPGEQIPYRSGLPERSESHKLNKDSLRRIAHWRAKRTHEIGQGTDNVSIWEHVD